MIALVLLSGIVLAFECQDQTEFWNAPCEIITPVLAVTGSCNATIKNVNNTAINTTINMTEMGDGTYNFTFPYGYNKDNISTYSIILCENTTGTIDVIFGIEQYETNFNLWLILFVIFFTLFIFGFCTNNHIFLFVSGALLLLMGIWIFQNGISIYNVDYWWVYPFAWVVTGLGIILTVVPGIEFIDGISGGEE